MFDPFAEPPFQRGLQRSKFFIGNRERARDVGARGAQLPVEVNLLPARENGRFLGGKTGFHREVRLRKEDGAFMVWLFGHAWAG